MSVNRSIFAALDARLAAFTPAMPTAMPNAKYTPSVGTGYLKVDHLPAAPVRRSIGVDGQNAYTGIYQVTVCMPSDGGAGPAETKADAIANHFPMGALYSGVRIAAVSIAPAQQDGVFYKTPVSITYELVTSA